MAKARSDQPAPTLSWELRSSSGPAVAHHVGGIIRGALYIHGGITTRGSTSPSNRFFRYDIGTSTWQEITAHGSPALSHHAGVVIQDRYFVLIGGWEGRARTSDVHVFDTEKERWRTFATTGFPIGAGLSSHTVNLLAKNEILVIGREGSLRMQRRSGNAFLLNLDLSRSVGHYQSYPMGVASRSGHSATLVGNRVVVFGGRDDHLIEQHPGYTAASDSTSATILTSLSTRTDKSRSLTKLPCGRKHHIGIPGSGCMLIHGGETFDGRSRFPVGEAYLVKFKPVLSVFKAGETGVGRAGHVGVTDGENIFIHGGIGERNLVNGDLFQLRVQ